MVDNWERENIKSTLNINSGSNQSLVRQYSIILVINVAVNISLY